MTNTELISRESNIARLRVSLDSATVEKAYSALYRELAGTINVPGFRKGKVPPNIIRQRVGVDAINEEVTGKLRELAVDSGLQELGLLARAGNTVWHLEPAAESGKEFVAEFSQPVLPEIVLPNLGEIEIQVERPVQTDEMRQRFLDRLLDRFSKANQLERESQVGDTLVIGIHSKFGDNQEDAPFGGHDIFFTIGREGNLPGWDEQMTGLRAGEAKHFDFTLPEDYAEAAVAGKQLQVHVHVDAVMEIERPDFTEEFVKERLHLESVEQFNEYRNSLLERELDSQLMTEIRERCGRELAHRIEAELSPDMIEQELDSMVSEADSMMRQNGSNLDAFLQSKGQSLQEYRAAITDSAHAKLKFHLGVIAVSRAQGFSATREEIADYAQAVMERENMSIEELKELLRNRYFINELSYSIVRDKVLAFLAGAMKVTVEGEPELSAPEAASEG